MEQHSPSLFMSVSWTNLFFILNLIIANYRFIQYFIDVDDFIDW